MKVVDRTSSNNSLVLCIPDTSIYQLKFSTSMIKIYYIIIDMPNLIIDYEIKLISIQGIVISIFCM